MEQLAFTESIQNYFHFLCIHHLSRSANTRKVLVVREEFNANQVKQLKKCLYHQLYASLYSPYILIDHVTHANWEIDFGNVYSGISEEVFKILLAGKDGIGERLLDCADKLKKLKNQAIDNVLRVLLLLANHLSANDPMSKKLVFKKNISINEFHCFQFDSRAYALDEFKNEHIGGIEHDDPLFSICQSQIFDEKPGLFCYQNSAPFLREETVHAKHSQCSLFGGLASSVCSSMDVSLNLPQLPAIPQERELVFVCHSDSFTDEGFNEPSTISLFTPSESESEENKSMLFWDEAAKLGKLKTFSWEKEDSYNTKFNNLYLTESGDNAFDCMYTRKLCEIERITGKMIDANMCTLSQIYRDSLNALVGVPSQSYTFYPMSCSLKPKSNLRCSGLSLESLYGLMTKFAQVGTYYRQLNKFSLHHSDKPLTGLSGGLILKAFINALKDILYSYWSAIFIVEGVKDVTLMELWGVFSTFARQLKFLADLCLCSEAFKRTTKNSPKPKFPVGASLLSYLYSLSVKNSSTEHYQILLYLFKSAANPFIRFITDWIFDGTCYDPYNEFFVQIDQHYLCFRDKHFWTDSFNMKQSTEAIPLFLDDLADNIFACGKAINLLKLTNIQHYLFERGHIQPAIGVTFSSSKLDSVEHTCQNYLSEMERARIRQEQTKELKKVEEDEEWKSKLKEQKQKTLDAVRKIEDLEIKIKKAIQAKKQQDYEDLKIQFEQAVLERKKERDDKFLEDQHWMEEIKKHFVKDDKLKNKAKEDLIAFYKNLSRVADGREFRANWIISRHEMAHKRKEFFKKDEMKVQHEINRMHQQNALQSQFDQNHIAHYQTVSFDVLDGMNRDYISRVSSELTHYRLPDSVEDLVITNADEKSSGSHNGENTSVHQVLQELRKPFAVPLYQQTIKTDKSAVQLNSIEGAETKHLLYPSDTPISVKDSKDVIDLNSLEGAETKHLLYPSDTPISVKDSKDVIDLNSLEGAETKHLLYPGDTSISVKNSKHVIDLNSLEGAETKHLLYPSDTPISVMDSKHVIDLNSIEGAETKHLLYPSDTPISVKDSKDLIDLNNIEGAETKHLLYPSDTPISVKDSKHVIDLNSIEGAETKHLLYPGDTSISVKNSKDVIDLNSLEGAETKHLLYPSDTPISVKDSKDVIDLNSIEGAETKHLLYPSNTPISVKDSKDVIDLNSIEGAETKHLLYDRDITSNQVKAALYTRHDFERPSVVQSILYPDNADHKKNEEIKRASRGFEPPTTITRLLYPLTEKKVMSFHHVQELTFDEVWMDSVVEPFQDDFSAMDMEPQPYLFGDTNRSISEHYYQSTPETDASLIKQLPLETIIKRSLTAPIQAQVSLVNSAVIKYFMDDLTIEVHFDAFRKFLLLEDGEFGHSLCSQLFEKVSSGMKPQDLCNTIQLNNIIIEALRLSLYAPKIECSSQLTFELKWVPDVFQPSDVGALDFLELRYRVPWPCNIIVTENSITKYNKVFSFLLKLKKAGWSLQEIWVNLKNAGHDKKAAMSPHLRQLQLYRHEMQHFVNNLERYIVNQIIHVSWREFQQDLLTKVHSLDDLHKCHVNYLNKIIFRSLLSKNAAPVYKLINDIFGMIAKFEARLMTTPWQLDELSGHVTHPLFSKLKAVHSAFKQYGEFLFSVISKLVRRGYQNHLDDLLLQVNFNAYYTTAVVKK